MYSTNINCILNYFSLIHRKFSGRKGIIKKRELKAIQQCTRFLKEHCRSSGLFLNVGSKILVVKIMKKIQSGDENLYTYLKNYCSPRECATALNNYLRKIDMPLLSERVQQFILSDNYGVCPRIVALDALSLLFEDLEGDSKELFVTIMDMIRTLSTVGSLKPTEVRVSQAPYFLIPHFFSVTPRLQETLNLHWGSISDILNEMVISFNFFHFGAHFKPDSSIFIKSTQSPEVRRFGGRRTIFHQNSQELSIRCRRVLIDHNVGAYATLGC